MKTLLALLSMVLSASLAAAADFTLDQILSAPFSSELTAARDAQVIAWTMNLAGRRNVWVAETPAFKARQLTHYDQDDGQALASVRLTSDGAVVVFVRGGEANEAGVVPNPLSTVRPPHEQVFAVAVASGAPWLLGEMDIHEEGGEDVQISPDGRSVVWASKGQLWIASLDPLLKSPDARQLTFARGAQSQPRWSPDGKRIAFVSDRGDQALLAVYDLDSDRIRYPAPSPDRDLLPRWSPDGKQLAFLRLRGVQRKVPLIPERPSPWSIWVAAEGAARAIWQSSTDESGDFPGWAADRCFHFGDQGRIVFASEQDGRNHLYSITASGGPATLLTPGDFDVEEASLSADRRSVLYTSNQVTDDAEDVDRRHLWRVPLAGGAPAPLTHGASLEWSPRECAGSVVCLGSTATTPAVPYVVRAQGREMIAPDAIPASFPKDDLVVPRAVTFPSGDGVAIHGQLFVPRSHAAPGPALVFTHGGPPRQMMLGFHYMDYYHNAYAANQWLASRGYVVLSVNYRLGIMYGRAFREAKHAGWRGSAEYADVVAGARYLATVPGVDPKHIGLWGGSYGGLLTALGLARNSDLFAAGVDFHGVHDWSAFLADWESNPMAAPDAQEAVKLAFASSPNASVDRWRSPVLLIQGGDDRNVPASQTITLVQLLREHGVPFEQIFLPDEIHDFLLHETWRTTYAAMGEFFDRVLKRGEAIGVH